MTKQTNSFRAPREPDLHQMVRNLSQGLDQAIDPQGRRTVVPAGLIRLALAVYVQQSAPIPPSPLLRLDETK